MENLMTINAESRSEVGKKISTKLRREGKIPAIIYGEKQESIAISLLRSDVKAILKTESGANTVLNIRKEDTGVSAMLKEVQYDYLNETIIHADFIRIDLNKAVIVNVPIEVTGEPVGVKLEDGFFDFINRVVKVKCLPTQIPREFILDVSGLHAGNSIKAENIPLADGVKLISDPHRVICTVASNKNREVEGTPGKPEAK